MMNDFIFRYKTVSVFLVLMLLVTRVYGQEKAEESKTIPLAGIKTNLLYDATTSINLGVEFRTGNKTSFDLSGNWNPWAFSNNRKWKHVLIQPEFRLWTKETFKGHFFGIHTHYAFYNVSNLPKPFSQNMRDSRYQGWLAGAGLSYGYRWNFNRNWAMEATLGAGYAYMDYDKYPCAKCSEKEKSGKRNYFGPTKAGITLIYNLGSKKKPAKQPTPNYIPAVIQETPEPVTPVVVEPKPEPIYIPPVKSDIEVLAEKYPFVLPASDFNPSAPIQFYNDERDNTLTVFYRLNSSVIEADFSQNGIALASLLDAVNAINNHADAKISHIVIAGFASPEGSLTRNTQLAGDRAAAVRDYILANTTVGKETIILHNGSADWQGLRKLVATDSNIPSQSEVLKIIDNQPIWNSRTQTGRQTLLRQLNGGQTWKYLQKNIFPELRNGTFIRVYWNEASSNDSN